MSKADARRLGRVVHLSLSTRWRSMAEVTELSKRLLRPQKNVPVSAYSLKLSDGSV